MKPSIPDALFLLGLVCKFGLNKLNHACILLKLGDYLSGQVHVTFYQNHGIFLQTMESWTREEEDQLYE